MTTPLARVGIALLGGVLLALNATAAHASNEINIDHVRVERGTVSMLLSVDALGDATVDGENTSITVDGTPVDVTIKPAASGDIERSTMIVLDTSNSMAEQDRISAATEAIKSYLDATPPDIRVGLVTFAGKVKQVIEPSVDRAAILSAIETVELTRGTRVYDAIDAAVAALGPDGARSLLVLSDGADTGSASTLEVTSGGAMDAGVVVDVVALQDPDQAKQLSVLADDSGGSIVPADPKGLSSVLESQGQALAHQLVMSFDVPAGASQEASVDVTIVSDGQTYADSAFVSLMSNRFDAPDVVASGKALVSKPVMLLGALALALGMAGLLTTVLTGASDGRSTSARRLDSYFGESGKGRRKAEGSTDLKGSAVAMTDRVVSADLETRVSGRLAGAGSAFTASEWLLLHAAIAVGSAFVGFIMGGGGLGALGLLLGAVTPWVYLKFRHSRRLSRFNGQLAETLGLIAGGLQAGLSLPQAVDSVVREGSEPMAGELRRALVEQRLGVDITDALEGVGQRMDSEDFNWIVMAIRIQREVGGNLAEILHTVADTLREREYLRRQVKALSAEGRLSGYILTGLPPLIGLYMMFANPDYISVLYTTVPGFVLLAVAGFMLILGSFAMAKLSKVEV
jgi:tight adherence protein B